MSAPSTHHAHQIRLYPSRYHSPHPKRALFATLLLLLPARAGFAQPPGPPAPEPARPAPGALVVCGGGKLPDAVRDHFIELAGGARARIVVIPTASAKADTPEVAKALVPWQNQKVASVVLLHTRSRPQANDPAFLKPLTEATGVWISGGDQRLLTAAYLDTAVLAEIKKVLARGGVVGGTSAGAAVMSRVMICGGVQLPEIDQGFGLLAQVIVDQHFNQRNRLKRLQAALAKHPDLVGLGVDELSMAPSLIPPAKEAIRRWSLTHARALAQRALGLDEAEAVRRAVAGAREKS